MAELFRNKIYQCSLLITFLSAILIGCTDGNGASQRITGKDAQDSIMLADGYEMLPLFKTKTGHITVTIKVNGKPCVFLVDTGGGGTLIDISKKERYQLAPQAIRDYAAGIGSVSPLIRTSANFSIGDKEFKDDSLFLMDISYLNAEFKKNKSRQVDGVLGTDFMERHHAVIDYSRSSIYLKINPLR